MKCVSCGCDRNITLKADVSIGEISVKFKRLCIYCFLRAIDLTEINSKGQYNFAKAMELVK